MTMNLPVCNTEEVETKSPSQTLWDSLSSPRDKRGGRALFAFYNNRHMWKRYGSLKSFCWATHLLSPLSSFWWMTELFVVVTTLLFIFHLYPEEVLIPSVTCWLAVFQLTAFYKTCLKDPGVLARPHFVTAFRNLLEVVSLSGYQKDDGVQRVARYCTNSKGKTERQTFCFRCNHFRPPKTVHCEDCDCCILKYHHHCPVYGGCVTDKNSVSFLMMVLGQLMFWFYVWGYSIYCIFTYDKIGNGLLIPLVVLIELLVAIFIPLVVILCDEKSCIRPRHHRVGLPLVVKEEDVEELLSFALINNFTGQEMDEIYKLYHDGDGTGCCTSMGGKGDMEKPTCSSLEMNKNRHDLSIV